MSKQTGQLPQTPSPVRVGKLDTLAAVRTEIARLYRGARRAAGADPDAQTAGRLGYLLNILGRSLESQELERRISELEKRLGKS